jgi:hypothetical protein
MDQIAARKAIRAFQNEILQAAMFKMLGLMDDHQFNSGLRDLFRTQVATLTPEERQRADVLDLQYKMESNPYYEEHA